MCALSPKIFRTRILVIDCDENPLEQPSRLRQSRACGPQFDGVLGHDPVVGMKNRLSAGSDGGAERWAILAPLLKRCKISSVDPQPYIADASAKILDHHPVSRIDEFLRFTS